MIRTYPIYFLLALTISLKYSIKVATLLAGSRKAPPEYKFTKTLYQHARLRRVRSTMYANARYHLSA